MNYCVIIGGAGFIGMSVCQALLGTGRKLAVVDILPRPLALNSSVRYLQVNFSDLEKLGPLLQEADEIIHLAHIGFPGYSRRHVVMELSENALPTICLMEFCATLKLRRFILMSSGGAVYGPPKYLPLNEEHPTNPISPYGITKLTIERFAKFLFLSRGFPLAVVRPGNAYGETQLPGTGIGFISTLIDAFINNKPLVQYGPRGTIRDYIYVDDIARGIEAILEYGEVGETYNLGTGVGCDNLQLLGLVRIHAQSSGFSSPAIEQKPFRFGDVDINVLDSEKLQTICDWSPRVEIAMGIQRCWDITLKNRVL